MEQPKEQEELTQQQELNEAKSLVEKMKRLLDNNDYKVLMAHLQANLDSKTLACFGPPNGLDGVLDNVYKRGQVAGQYDAMNFAKLLLEGAEGTIDKLEPNVLKINEEGFLNG